MAIQKNKVVSFHYTVINEAGEPVESSRERKPMTYLHGANNIIRGLEGAMAGHVAGDSFSVELVPGQAYGMRNEQMQQKVPVKHLLFRGKLRPGMIVGLNTDKGQRSVTVLKVGRHSATIDGNHPLAGKSLRFEVEVADVRAATSEELAHGHAHGPGGHQH